MTCRNCGYDEWFQRYSLVVLRKRFAQHCVDYDHYVLHKEYLAVYAKYEQDRYDARQIS